MIFRRWIGSPKNINNIDNLLPKKKDKVNRVTVEYFNHIAQIMNIKTVAEFVEDEAILKQLQAIGVDYAQGYGISQPRPLICN